MLFKVVLVAFILLSIYLGNVLGCSVLCEMFPTIGRAKSIVWKVPFMHLDYIKDMILAKNWKNLRIYFATPCKNLVMMGAWVASVECKDIARKMAQELKELAEQPNKVGESDD